MVPVLIMGASDISSNITQPRQDSTGEPTRTAPTGPRVLAVDDTPANLALIERHLTREGCTVLKACDGEEGMRIFLEQTPDLVITDVMMPRRNGYELCRGIKEHPAARLTPVVLVTSLNGVEERVRGIEAGADDFLAKPVDAHELRARVRSLLRLKRYTDDLDSAEAMIMSLALTIEARDHFTEGHCQRLAQLAAGLGWRLGLGADDIQTLERGGILHDIGKVGIPDAILLKPAPLTPEEFDTMKTHTTIGDRLCSELRLLKHVRPIVRHHHERLDGSGYPDGLRGRDVPLLAQIVGIADVFDALTSARPYREPFPIDRAFEALTLEAQKGWRDPALVTAFIDLRREDSV